MNKFQEFRNLFEAGFEFEDAFASVNLDPRIEHIAYKVWMKWEATN